MPGLPETTWKQLALPICSASKDLGRVMLIVIPVIGTKSATGMVTTNAGAFWSINTVMVIGLVTSIPIILLNN